MNQSLEETLQNIAENPNTTPEQYAQDLRYAMVRAVKETNLSRETQDAIEILLEGLKPSEDQMNILLQQMEQNGQEIPEALIRGIDSVNAAKSGDRRLGGAAANGRTADCKQ